MNVRTFPGLVALAAALCSPPVAVSAQTLPSASGPQVILYELAENLKGSKGSKLTRRAATATLSGFAIEGSPLCPEGLGKLVDENDYCTVNVSGRDNISLKTGKGTLNGTFTVTVQGDNPLDAPEAVALHGTFNGTIDLSAALTGAAPIGTLTGSMVLAAGGGSVPIHGVFRLPTVCEGGIGYLRTDEFGNPTGGCDPIKESEMLFGYPMVRLDIFF